jgi:hypothetical protein
MKKYIIAEIENSCTNRIERKHATIISRSFKEVSNTYRFRGRQKGYIIYWDIETERHYAVLDNAIKN